MPGRHGHLSVIIITEPISVIKLSLLEMLGRLKEVMRRPGVEGICLKPTDNVPDSPVQPPVDQVFLDFVDFETYE
jgi:hypothetical protein